MKAKDAVGLFRDAGKEWSEDNALRLSAALAYYALFSLAPMLVIVLSILALVYGQEAAQGQLFGQIEGIVGGKSAEAIQAMLAASSSKAESLVSTLIGLVTLFIGATAVFGELESALNTVWEVTPRPDRGILGMIKDRFASFLMIVVIGLLLLVTTVASTVIAAAGGYFQDLLPGGEAVWQGVNLGASFVILTVTFALLFKFVPDVEIAWTDVLVGAALTAFLFVIGKHLIGLYLGRSSVSSAFGAAGSLVAVMVWIYYSALILLYGAEFTQVYATRFGSRVRPDADAVPVTEEMRAEQGMPRREGVARATRRGTSAETEGQAVPKSPEHREPEHPPVEPPR
jgi:membrane protein